MNEQQEFDELNAFVKMMCNSSKFRHGLEADDVVQELYSVYPDATLAERKAKAKEVIYDQMNDRRKFLMEPELKDENVKSSNENTRTRRAWDEEYRLKSNKGKNDSAKRIREKGGPPHEKIKAAKRKVRADHNAVRNSDQPQKCKLVSENKCIREVHKYHYNHTVCPFQDKFCLKGGYCYPLDKNNGGN